MGEQRKRQCSTCEHYGAPRGKRLYHAHAYRCRWALPPIEWPSSVSGRAVPIVTPHHMQPGEGKDCPQWRSQIVAPANKEPSNA